MGFREHCLENMFSYRADVPSATHLKDYLAERKYPKQANELVVIIPDRNEDPEALRSTVIQVAMSNFLTGLFHQVDGEHFRVNKIIVGDQSNQKIAKKNKGLLYTVNDLLSKFPEEAYIPDIYHLHFDEEMGRMVFDYMNEYMRIAKNNRGKPPLGKGVNMALSSLMTDDNTALVFMDAENKEVSYQDAFLLGSPLIYEGSPSLFTKAAFMRYHMEGDRRKLGGRVNAALGVPLIYMLAHKGLLDIEKPIIYPLSGEIGINKDLLWSIIISKRYGVETTTLLQLFGGNGDGQTLSGEQFLQVDLGINMDQPIAEGRPKRSILAGVRKMSDDIVKSTFQIMGDGIREGWGSPKEFNRMFAEAQECSTGKWTKSHGTDRITGGVDPGELRETVCEVLKGHTERLFSEDGADKYRTKRGFIPPIEKIREDMGERFYDFKDMLVKHSERTYPYKKP